jgi:hypothetical protein
MVYNSRAKKKCLFFSSFKRFLPFVGGGVYEEKGAKFYERKKEEAG